MTASPRRIDDPSAILDQILAQASLAIAIAIAIVAVLVPSMRGALIGACVVGSIAAIRLLRHPLRAVSLARVFVDGDRILVAPVLGRARPVDVIRIEHDGHAPWPCALELADGRKVPFVARRDAGLGAFFDLEIDDRARYERPQDARDSLVELEQVVRASAPPAR